jgi:CheY-like chemotaxis protein
MGGRIWVESEYGKGSTFIFEVKLADPEKQNEIAAPKNISAKDVRLLIVDADIQEKDYLKIILNSFGITADETDDLKKAVDLILKAVKEDMPYDVILLDYPFVNESGMEYIKESPAELDKSKIAVMSSFLYWNKIEEALRNAGIVHYISKPLFPSAILDSINEVTGGTVKSSDADSNAAAETPDLSGFTLLLAEDVDINQEIFAAMLQDTGIEIDIADNGRIALERFKQNPDRYDIIIMDVQMPEMDGYEATRRIRDLNIPKAKDIPIIAMTANVFKEDVERCLAAGMNSHIGKPIDFEEVINKITHYCGRDIPDPKQGG